MINFKVKVEQGEVTDCLDSLIAQELPHALLKGINDIAFELRDRLQGKIQQVFNNPSPYIVNSLYADKATKGYWQATIRAKEGGNDKLDKILGPHIYGGSRTHKPSEWELATGGFLRSGEFTVPGRSAGKLTAGKYVQIISGLGSFSEVGYTANKRKLTGTQKQYVVIRKPGRIPMGIYERLKTKLKLLLLFVPKTNYPIRLPLEQTAKLFMDAKGGEIMTDALVEAIKTSKLYKS